MKYPGAGRGLLPYKRLMGMCCWMGSHFTTGLTIKLHILPKVTKMGSIMSPPPPPHPSVRQTQTADWQVNKVNIVVECSNRFPIPKLDFSMT